MVKLLENPFRAVNIRLVNEIALMCHKMDINVWEVIDAATTKPFGFMIAAMQLVVDTRNALGAFTTPAIFRL